jgi:hypothetical protein
MCTDEVWLKCHIRSKGTTHNATQQTLRYKTTKPPSNLTGVGQTLKLLCSVVSQSARPDARDVRSQTQTPETHSFDIALHYEHIRAFLRLHDKAQLHRTCVEAQAATDSSAQDDILDEAHEHWLQVRRTL